jgi:hypothetical protein
MDLSNGSAPNIVDSIQYTPDFNTSMQHSVTLANMMDQRRADLAARQRAGNIRDIFSQNSGAITDQSQVSPDILRQVYAQDPTTADAMQTANYKNMMGQGAYMRGGASQENAQTKKQTFTVNEIQKLANAHTNQLANTFKPIIDNPDDPEAQAKYTVAYNMMANGVGVPKDPTDPLEVSKITMSPEQFANLPTPAQFDPKTTPTILKSYQDYVLGLQNTYNNEFKKQQVANETNKTGAVVGELGAKAGVEGADAGLKTNQAGVVQQNADANTLKAEAAMVAAHRPVSASTFGITLSPDRTDALNRAILQGGLDPRQINSRNASILADMEIAQPGRQWNELSAQAGYERGASATNTKTLLNSITPMLDNLESAGKALTNTRFPGVNKLVNWTKEATGQPEIVAFNNLRDQTVAEVERGLFGTGVVSDDKYKREIRNIKAAASYPQLQAAVKATKLVIKTRLEAVSIGPNPGANRMPGAARNSGNEAQPQPDQLPTAQTVQAAVRPIEDVYADIQARAKAGNQKAQDFLKLKGKTW